MSSPSLLSFLDAPVVVGDPDGRAAYVNPAFEARFSISAGAVTGEPLASLFEGGVREAVLGAVAKVCEKGSSVRLRVRHAGVGYSGVASPIVAEDARVGYLILLLETSAQEERVLALQRDIHGPLEEVAAVLDELLEQTGGKRSEKYHSLVEEAIRALARVRKWSEELSTLLVGKPGATASLPDFDPARVVGDAVARVAEEYAAAGVEFDVRVPSRLPRVRGESARLRQALVHLLRVRLAGCGDSSTITLAARALERGGACSVILALIDAHPDQSGGDDVSEAEPAMVRRLVRELGGELRTSTDGGSGRTTAIRLPALKE